MITLLSLEINSTNKKCLNIEVEKGIFFKKRVKYIVRFSEFANYYYYAHNDRIVSDELARQICLMQYENGIFKEEY